MYDLLRFQWPRCVAGYDIIDAPEAYFDDSDCDPANNWLPTWAGADLLPEIGHLGEFKMQRTVFSAWRPHVAPRAFVAPFPGAEVIQHPLEDGALFRNFAALDGSRKAILDFAGQYGQIYRHQPALLAGQEVAKPVRITALVDWEKEIAEMRGAVALWDQAKSATTTKRKIDGYDDLLGRFNGLGLKTMFGLELPRKRGAPQPLSYINPISLRDALWIQFGRAVADDAEYRRCVHCGSWFRIGGPGGKKAGGAKKKTIYCSPKCNSAAWARRSRRDTSKSGENERSAKPAGESNPLENKG